MAWASNPAFDASTMEVWGPLLNGGRVVVIEQKTLLDEGRFGEELRRQRVSMLWMTVGLFNQYAHALKEEFSRLQYLMVGGDALEAVVIRRVLAESAPGHLINGYGPTETTTFAATYEIKEVAAAARTIPIGRPIGNTQIYILDEEGEAVPIGVCGEIYIGGKGVARGYVNRPELTAERFVPDGYSREAGARMYRTGDLGRWRGDGNIEFVGRNDFQVKVRGYRIELGEIEARLAEHPEVREAVVVVREDRAGEKQLVAYYTCRQSANCQESNHGAVAGAEQLRTHLAAKLPEYMVPAAYVRVEAMPLTVNGKLDRGALPEPEGNAYAAKEYEAPVGEVEEAVAAIWSEVLGVKRVGRWDNFFELGGHSLLAIRVTARIRQQLGLEVSISELFKHPELTSYAEMLSLSKRRSPECAVPIRQNGGAERPLFLTHEGADEIVYAYVLAPHIDSEIPVYALPAQQNGDCRLWTVEGMAQRMVKMIRAVQPLGPYRIGAYGGFAAGLAYEIATQLLGADEEIELLALLDPQLVNADHFLPDSATVNHDLRIEFLSIISTNARMSGKGESVQAAVQELKNSSQTFEEVFRYCKGMGWLLDTLPYESPVPYQKICQHKIDQKTNPYSISALPITVNLFIAKDDKLAPNAVADFVSQVPGSKVEAKLIPGAHFTILQCPNVRQLGLSLSQVIREKSREKASLSAPESRVCLRSLKSSTESRFQPLFCIPEAASGADCFSDLSSSLEELQSIYAFQPRGLKDDGVPHSTVEAVAAFYVDELIRAYPDGPVHLIGHLLGGWIAFEMALMLYERGRTELSLTVLDSDPPGSSYGIREYTRSDIFARCLEMIELLTGRLPTSIVDLELEAADVQREMLLCLLIDCGLLPIGSEAGDLRRLLKMIGVGLRTNYVPRRTYPGTIRLILAAGGEKSTASPDGTKVTDSCSRWAVNVVTDRVPGNGMTMLKTPHVRILAEVLGREIDMAAQRQCSSSIVTAD